MPSSVPTFNFNISELFLTSTVKELYEVINKSPNHKSAVPENIISCSLKNFKLPIGTQLQF